MITFRKPVSTFRDHALIAGALVGLEVATAKDPSRRLGGLLPALLRQRRRNRCVPWNAGWQAHGEHRALAGLARHRDVAAHHTSELAGDCEAQARTAEPLRGRGLSLAELLEQFAELLRRHAD